jgi:hypothetical protein
MRFAIIGYSSFVQRKLISEIRSAWPEARIDIFSRRDISEADKAPLAFKKFTDLSAKLRDERYVFVYVSCENALHYELCRLALSLGHNTIVDKPLALEWSHVNELCEIAQDRDLALSESLIWLHHRQVRVLKEFAANTRGLKASSFFTIPMLEATNFRLSSQKGSGVFWDMGTYMASLMKILSTFDDINVLSSFGLGKTGQQQFTVEGLSNKRKLRSTFGFGYKYRNKLLLGSDERSITFDRIFTSENNQPVEITHRHGSSYRAEKILDNSMGNYLEFVSNIIADSTLKKWEMDEIRSRHCIIKRVQSKLASLDR